ncbi:type III secretion system chaperone [Mixta sp. Marseille-Q2659]|uniref:type III secretion system chaperone n=1 Tax=Mixta sp. Marseille-Q2659 TaxID=2736607 RepID=UPI0023B97763|nr:type III secretion system chaperone [Mixta sp. Marseille-Q2659]
MDSLYLQRLLEQYGRTLNTELTLDNGVCVLLDQQQELAVLELPPGDNLLLHCQILPSQEIRDDAALWRALLAMNFEMEAMRGCWLALDTQLTLRLCCQHPLAQMDAPRFTALVNNFIDHGQQVREFMPTLLARLAETAAA